VDLRRQLPRRFEDQDVSRRQTTAASAGADEKQSLEQRERERGRFTGASDSRPGDVSSKEGERDARGLLGIF